MMNLQRRNFMQFVFSVICIDILPCSLVHAESVQIDIIGNTVLRHLRFLMTLRNPLDRPLIDQGVWLYVPVQKMAYQKLESINVEWPHRTIHDALGNTILELKFDLPAFAHRIVNVSVEVRLKSTPDFEPLFRPEYFLGEESYLEINDPKLRKLAAQLKTPDPHTTVKAIYDWVATHIQYAGFVAEDKGALVALTTLRGDCTEYAYLVAGLARANGLPARVMAGFVVDHDAVLRASDFHNWAEVYVGGKWILVDAQKQNFDEKYVQYIATKIISEKVDSLMSAAHRFISKGGVQVSLN